jgi:hypothetical protein
LVVFGYNGYIAFNLYMSLRLVPGCLDTYEDIPLSEYLAAFEVDLSICAEEGEIVFVGVLAIA